MIIESTSLKTVIDLLESLRKNSLSATGIRLSYTNYGGLKKYVTFNSLDELKALYTKDYNTLVKSRRSPFTEDPALAASNDFITTVGDLILISNIAENEFNFFKETFCTVGSLVTLESFNLQSYLKEYDFSFIVKDVTSNIKILENSKFDLRRQSEIKTVLDRFKSSVTDYIKIYNEIYIKLKYLFIQGSNVDICYAEIGYFKFTFELYKLFFFINKRGLNTGITNDAFNKMYLRTQNN